MRKHPVGGYPEVSSLVRDMYMAMLTRLQARRQCEHGLTRHLPRVCTRSAVRVSVDEEHAADSS